ncbi:MAG: hypothetical protein ACE5JU_16875 [Candidatus Binatia bacterium]
MLPMAQSRKRASLFNRAFSCRGQESSEHVKVKAVGAFMPLKVLELILFVIATPIIIALAFSLSP